MFAVPRRKQETQQPLRIPGLYTRPYLDASVFIAWIQNEVVERVRNGVRETVNRVDIAQHVLTLAEHGHYTIYTSTITYAEVFKPKGHNPLEPKVNQDFIDYLENDFIRIVEVDREIGIHANRLAALYGLNANDAIHTASALRAECDVVLAWDDPFTGRNGIVPGIRIEEPEKLGQQLLELDNAID